MWPYLGEVERVIGGFLGLFFGHHLDIEGPFGEVAPLDGSIQSFLVCFPGFANGFFGFLVGHVLMSLLGLKVEFYPKTLTTSVPETVGMRAVSIHVHGCERNATVGMEDGDLVETFGCLRPEVPFGRIRS